MVIYGVPLPGIAELILGELGELAMDCMGHRSMKSRGLGPGQWVGGATSRFGLRWG